MNSDYNDFIQAYRNFLSFRAEDIEKQVKSLISQENKYVEPIYNFNFLLKSVIFKAKNCFTNKSLTETELKSVSYLTARLVQQLKKDRLSDKNSLSKDELVNTLYNSISDYVALKETDFFKDLTDSALTELTSSLPPAAENYDDLSEFFIKSKKKQHEFRPLIGLFFFKLALLAFFAISFGVTVLTNILSDNFLTYFIKIDDHEALKATYLSFRQITLILLLSVLIITVIDIIRLLIMKSQEKKGNVSATFSYAYYMLFSPFFIYNILSVILRTKKKNSIFYTSKILDCASIGYIPAVYFTAFIYYQGLYNIEKDKEKAIKYFRLCGKYKKAKYFLEKSVNE